MYDYFQEKIQACDDEIAKNMAKFATDSKVIDTPIEQLNPSKFTLYRSQTSLGAYLRRLKSHKGPMKAITATAHKLAKIIYNMLRHGVEYKEAGQTYYEEQYRGRVLKNLKRKAAEFGFDLVELTQIMKIKNV